MSDGGEENENKLPNIMTNVELPRVVKEHDTERKEMKREMEKLKEQFKKGFNGNFENDKEGSDEETPWQEEEEEIPAEQRLFFKALKSMERRTW